jgi:hypothetical protein
MTYSLVKKKKGKKMADVDCRIINTFLWFNFSILFYLVIFFEPTGCVGEIFLVGCLI